MVHPVNKVFHAGDYIPARNIANGFNRTQLQSVLRWSITSVRPSEISLSAASAADPDATALFVSVNIRQTWSIHPARHLTLCTANTILGDRASRQLIMTCGSEDDQQQRWLLGDPLVGIKMPSRQPQSDDWKTELPFLTIPPLTPASSTAPSASDQGTGTGGDDGVTITKEITFAELFSQRDRPVSPDTTPESYPRPGDEFALRFADSGLRKETFTDWWNWGDLDGDLRGVKLVDIVNPKVNPRGPQVPPEGSLLPFASWEEEEADEHGNRMVWLQVHIDTSPVVVRFVE